MNAASSLCRWGQSCWRSQSKWPSQSSWFTALLGSLVYHIIKSWPGSTFSVRYLTSQGFFGVVLRQKSSTSAISRFKDCVSLFNCDCIEPFSARRQRSMLITPSVPLRDSILQGRVSEKEPLSKGHFGHQKRDDVISDRSVVSPFPCRWFPQKTFKEPLHFVAHYKLICKEQHGTQTRFRDGCSVRLSFALWFTFCSYWADAY